LRYLAQWRILSRMARNKKRPELVHCKVREQSHPTAPWRVSYKVERDGKPVTVRKSFRTEDAAWIFAEERENEIKNHGLRYGDIPAEARRAFDFFRDAAADLAELGASVPTFEELVADGVAAIRTRHHEQFTNATTLADAVEAFKQYKAGRVGTRQADDIKNHLKRFSKDFGKRTVKSITTAEIEAWLSSLRSRKNPAKLPVPPIIGPIARNAYRMTLHGFFKHGANPTRGWCATNPVAAIEAEKSAPTEPQAYAPQDVAKIMQAALELESPLLPALALEMFAGLRPSEAMALDLVAIDLAADDFRVPGIKPNGERTKTGARIAPLLPAAKAWIAAQTRRAGMAYDAGRREHSREMQRILKAAKVKGIHDGPRHSFISYRTAEIRDVARVADEAGNSPNIIKSHYRKIVSEAAAAKFFAIRPEAKAKNITSIQDGRKTA